MTVSNGTLNLAPNAATNLTGSDDVVYFTGTGDYVGINSGTDDTVYGDDSGDSMNLFADTSATVTGS
jgi:hypothetical protein